MSKKIATMTTMNKIYNFQMVPPPPPPKKNCWFIVVFLFKKILYIKASFFDKLIASFAFFLFVGTSTSKASL